MSRRRAPSIAAACAAVLWARLSGPLSATAQMPGGAADPVLPRVEIGASAGVIANLPTAGILASVPAARWLAVEGTVGVAPDQVVSQAQVRVRLRLRWRSRRSLVAGLTHAAGRGSQITRGLGAHVGVSFQGMVYRYLDVRADLQQVIPFDDGPDADPRVALTFVWHR
jgi:hypothetical protein